MNERHIALHSAVSYLLWPTGFVLVVLGLLTEFELGQLGIVVCLIAATLTVRGYFCGLLERERNAFNVGREYEAGIRSLR